MLKKLTLAALAIAAACCVCASATPVKIKGVWQNDRYDDHANHNYSEYVGWNYTLQKAIFIVENGIYAMEVNDGAISAQPYKEPAVNKSDFYQNGAYTDDAKALWAANFNMMFGNSGAVKAGNEITTVFSRTENDDVDSTNIFAVRKWNATTGDIIGAADNYYPKKAWLESAGMCQNPVDGKVYGLFYLTDVPLPESITSDPDYEPEITEDGDTINTDSGYAICSIDLETMTVTQITPGLYYENFVTFAINSEGRAFALTSGNDASTITGEDGRIRDIDDNLAGATLYEFDLATGLMKANLVTAEDEYGESYSYWVSPFQATGYCSQTKRQSACFSRKDPNKMYWNGYVNSGKGWDDNGNYTSLPDRYWLTNGKYDTALYEVDITTGVATRIGTFNNRYTFSCMWVEEDEPAYGDVNQDGVWNAADVTALYNYILNGDTTFIATSDVNGDGAINSGDVTAVYNIILGL